MSSLEKQIERAEKRWQQSEIARANSAEQLNLLKTDKRKFEWRSVDTLARYQRRLERLGDIDAAEAIIEGAAADFNPLERIIGANQLTGIDFFECGIIAARSVARVRIRSAFGTDLGFGSGVLISPRLFLTNNHVLSNAGMAASSVLEFGYLKSATGLRDPLTFELRPGDFFLTHERLDFTVVAVEPVNKEGDELVRRGWRHLIAGSGKAVVGERVNIIQHPAGERLQIAVRDNEIVQVVDDFLLYVADTQQGSSGSPVFNDQWEMAALHHAGKPKRNAAGQPLMKNGQPWTGLDRDRDRIDWISNEGVRVSSIVAHVRNQNLKNEWQILWDAAFHPPEQLDIWDLIEGSICECEEDEAFNLPTAINRSVDKDGNPSWLFRLSFGPVDAPSNRSSKPPTRPDKSTALMLQNVVSSGDVGTGKKSTELAEQLFEKFRHDGLYYDKKEDEAAAKAYWKDFDWKLKASDLFPLLSNKLEETHTKRFSYERARHEFLYPSIDVRKDGKLKNIYSGEAFDPVETIAAEIALLLSATESAGLEASNMSLEALFAEGHFWSEIEDEASRPPFNCEHVVCQSWFDKRQPMKADIHHLFACGSRCNSFRNNIPYWQFPPEEEAFMESCGRTQGRTKFEPAHGKGAVARATMYFLMRYPGELGDDTGELPKSRTSILMNWHKLDSVDEYEKHRNWLTHKAQGNRNPFIDSPEIATEALLSLGFGKRR